MHYYVEAQKRVFNVLIKKYDYKAETKSYKAYLQYKTHTHHFAREALRGIETKIVNCQ